MDPASTPIKDERVSANAEPMNTYQIDLDFDARSIVESCVLSPSSAKKTSKNVVNIVFQTSPIIIHMPKRYKNLISLNVVSLKLHNLKFSNGE